MGLVTEGEVIHFRGKVPSHVSIFVPVVTCSLEDGQLIVDDTRFASSPFSHVRAAEESSHGAQCKLLSLQFDAKHGFLVKHGPRLAEAATCGSN